MDVEEATRLFNERKGKYDNFIHVITWSKLYKADRCYNCGIDLGLYETDMYTVDKTRWTEYKYCNDKIGRHYHKDHLCHDCFYLYKEGRHILRHHYPGCVEHGDSYEVYEWKGYDQFCIDYPLEKGWHYEYYDWKILEVTDDQKEWWVMWHFWWPDRRRVPYSEKEDEFDTVILNDLKNAGVKEWKYPKDKEQGKDKEQDKDKGHKEETEDGYGNEGRLPMILMCLTAIFGIAMLVSFCTVSKIFMIITGIGFALSGLGYFIAEWTK